MKIELDRGFARAMKREIENYKILVGVLDDKVRKEPAHGKDGEHGPGAGLTSYAGGPVAKLSGTPSKETNGEVLLRNMQRLGKNILAEPFNDKSSDLLRFTDGFLRMAIARKNPKRVENLLQALVRNPILRGEYGPSKNSTNKTKGFNRPLIDTAQMFKSIKARITRV